MSTDPPLNPLLALPGVESESDYAIKLRWLRVGFALGVAGQSWEAGVLRYAGRDETATLVALGCSLAAALLCAVEIARPRLPLVSWSLVAILGLGVLARAPDAANHFFLGLYAAIAIAALGSTDAARGALCVQFAKWLFAAVLFGAGLQKLLYGLYFEGEFLIHTAATENGLLAKFVRLLVSEGDVAALRSMSTLGGGGPFRLASSPLVLVASNLTWLAEVFLPAMLMWSRTRRLALWLVPPFLATIQVAAEEYTFFVLMLVLYFVYLPAGWQRNLVAVNGALQLLIAMRLL